MKVKIPIYLLLTLLIFFFSCAHKQKVWVKSDFNQTQFNQDVYRCQQDAQIYARSATGQTFNLANSSNKAIMMKALFGEKEVNYQLRFQQCMEVLGYQLEER